MANNCRICKRSRFVTIAGERRIPGDHDCLTKIAPSCEPTLDRLLETLRKAEVAISDLLLDREMNEKSPGIQEFAYKIRDDIEDLLNS